MVVFFPFMIVIVRACVERSNEETKGEQTDGERTNFHGDLLRARLASSKALYHDTSP